MKLKLKKIDKAQALEFVTAHVEKAVFGILLLCFVLFCIGAVNQKPYPKTPADFTTMSRSVDEKIGRSVFDPTTDVPPVKPLPEAHDVPEGVFDTVYVWNRPLNDVKKRRAEPKFLAIQEIRAGSGYGAVLVRVSAEEAAALADAGPKRANAIAPPRGIGMNAPRGLGAAAAAAAAGGAKQADMPTGSAVKGKQWAVITGLVPVANQAKEYRTVFRDARHTSVQLDQPQYETFEVERAEVQPGSADDVDLAWKEIDRQPLDEEMDLIAQFASDSIDQSLQDENFTQRPPQLQGKEHDRSITHPKIPRAAHGSGPAAAPQSAARPLGGGGLAGAARAASRITPSDSDAAKAPKIENKLFRFFDFSARPGKSYRYRVRLVLHNPNHNVAAQYLTNAQLAKGETRAAPWSEPTDVVTIPRGSSLLAGGVQRARGPNEQRAEVLVRTWDQKEAVDASKATEVVRGQVANFAAEDTPIDERTWKKISFQTDTLVLDMAGGDSLTGAGRAKALGQLLVLEPNGVLSVKSELADAEIYEPTRKRLEEWQKAPKPDSGLDGADDKDSKDSKKKKKDDAPRGLGGLGSAAAAAGGKAKARNP